MMAKSYLPHFLSCSSALIPATRAPVDPAAVRANWASAGALPAETLTIDLPVTPVFLVRDGTLTLLNEESMASFDALWHGQPPIILQHPGAAISAYHIDAADITANEELLLLSYFGDIEYRILPFSDHPWRPLVDQLHADPGTERLYTELVFHTPAAQLSASQMSKLFNRKVSEDSIRRYRKGLPPRHGVRTVSHDTPQAANDEEYEPSSDSVNANPESAPEEGAITSEPGLAASAGEAIKPPDPVPNDEPPDKTSPDDEVAHNDAAETGGDEHLKGPEDDAARPDADSTEPTEPPWPTEPAEPTEPNHSGPTRGRRLLNPLTWGNRRMRDE